MSRSFHPVICLPPNCPVLDFARRLSDEEVSAHRYAIGRYNEKRPFSYTTPLFEGGRNNHMGVDIFAPPRTPVFAFAEGVVHSFAYNAAAGDYGYTLVTRHQCDGQELYALHGHLSESSLVGKSEGMAFQAGDTIAWIGNRHENGGWVPHLHFQLSYERPERADMPGVVSDEDLAAALQSYPDPRLVLGPLY